ncbi:universal stress protein [Streptomyces fradiae]|uniref:universal stress protein n=1 Tax=Streptomyces fradiae TaxID=1906 RepID=UPI003516B75C
MNGTTARSGLGRVVVGVDGSPSADAAVIWAAAESALRGIRLVHAADTDTPVPFLTEAEIVRSRQARRDEACAVLAAVRNEADVGCARAAAGEEEFPNLTVQADGRSSHNVPGAFADASHHAGLLVFGGRRSPGYLGPTLRRITLTLLQHAHCPVELIPRQGPRHGSTS